MRGAAGWSAAAVVVAFGLVAAAQDPDKTKATGLDASLREAINLGADLFNQKNDYVGCFRIYQGALMAVRPAVGPAAQAEIDAALAEADAKPNVADRAFRLRSALDRVRDHVKAAAATPKDVATPKLEAPKVVDVPQVAKPKVVVAPKIVDTIPVLPPAKVAVPAEPRELIPVAPKKIVPLPRK